MGSNIAGAGAGLITTTARPAPTGEPSISTTDAELRYQRARAEGACAERWRGLARGLDWAADHERTLPERRRLRRLGDDCRRRADQLTGARQAVAA